METIWYSDPTRGCVHHIDAQGRLIRKYTQALDATVLGLPMGIAIMLNGDVLVVDARNHNVMQIAAGTAQKLVSARNEGFEFITSGFGSWNSGELIERIGIGYPHSCPFQEK